MNSRQGMDLWPYNRLRLSPPLIHRDLKTQNLVPPPFA